LDRPNRRECAEIRNVLGVVMSVQKEKNKLPALLDVAALLGDLPAERLARGQVGTVVESLDGRTVLVEFADDQGRAYAIAPCPRSQLLALRYAPEAA
jgi:hypothetical protein